ncbi:MAG: DUF1307 domain-containing protein [Bacilli bacterium]|nr:DUF1307 domain-containing protein [Bacilli bacterium]
MKKGVKILAISLCMFLLVGCSSKEEKIVTCTLTNDQSASGYKLDSTYKIYATDDSVTSVETEEVVTSDNEQIRNYFEKTLNDSYQTADKTYGGYTYNVKNEGNKVTSKVTIDYTKMNLDKFVKDNSSMKAYVNKDNKITLKGAKNIYESLGATCEE